MGWWGCADRAGVGYVGARCTRSRASELFSTKKTCSQERPRSGVLSCHSRRTHHYCAYRQRLADRPPPRPRHPPAAAGRHHLGPGRPGAAVAQERHRCAGSGPRQRRPGLSGAATAQPGLHVPAEAEGKVPVAYGYWCNSWSQDPAWRFVALGLGHDTDYWARFLTTITEIDPEMNVNIEHEDAEYGNVEGLQISARNLLEAAARL